MAFFLDGIQENTQLMAHRNRDNSELSPSHTRINATRLVGYARAQQVYYKEITFGDMRNERLVFHQRFQHGERSERAKQRNHWNRARTTLSIPILCHKCRLIRMSLSTINYSDRIRINRIQPQANGIISLRGCRSQREKSASSTSFVQFVMGFSVREYPGQPQNWWWRHNHLYCLGLLCWEFFKDFMPLTNSLSKITENPNPEFICHFIVQQMMMNGRHAEIKIRTGWFRMHNALADKALFAGLTIIRCKSLDGSNEMWGET